MNRWLGRTESGREKYIRKSLVIWNFRPVRPGIIQCLPGVRIRDGRLEAIVREKNMSFSEDVSDSGYDGVRFQIAVRRYDLEKKSFSSPEYLFERDAAAGDYFIKTSRLVLEMNAGDLLFFIVDGKSTNWCDHYSVMPKFDYTSTGESR